MPGSQICFSRSLILTSSHVREYPVEGGLPTNIYRPEDGANHALLMRKFREELDKLTGAHYLLTIAAPAGEKMYRHLKLSDLAQNLDFVRSHPLFLCVFPLFEVKQTS